MERFEILEVGMESTAEALLASFRTIYEPLYNAELKDLEVCKFTEDMVRLITYKTQHLESLRLNYFICASPALATGTTRCLTKSCQP